MLCSHTATTVWKPPSDSAIVYKNECVYCWKNSEEDSIYVCLHCWQGLCDEHVEYHVRREHPLYMKYQKTAIEDRNRTEQPPQKLSKVIIEPEQPTKYDIHTEFYCAKCKSIIKETEELAAIKTKILSMISAVDKANVDAWSEKLISCVHLQSLAQMPDVSYLHSERRSHCMGEGCDLKDNLWLCIVCGYVGCGRRQYDGSGGNGHGFQHFEQHQHSASVKLGTITSDGKADVYCYVCEEMRLDPHLVQHLLSLGIKVSEQEKTEKGMDELQLEQNLKFDFSMSTEDGIVFEAVSGPGFNGFKNLGNSCYMASSLQSLFHLNHFKSFRSDHHETCNRVTSFCFTCQFLKVLNAIDERPKKQSFAPWMFKAAIGRINSEFGTMRQQDAFEFLQFLLNNILKAEHSGDINFPLTQIFDFNLAQKIECQTCKAIRLSETKTSSLSLNIPKSLEQCNLIDCLTQTMQPEEISSICPKCKSTNARKYFQFKTFPSVFIFHLNKFELVDWVPKKIEMPVSIPENIDFAQFAFTRDANIIENNENVKDEFVPNEMILIQLMSMGFSQAKASKALRKTGNNDPDAAMGWILEHMDEPDDYGDSSFKGVNEETTMMLISAGFERYHVEQALKETGNDAERAMDWLLSHPADSINGPLSGEFASPTSSNYQLTSFVTHKGPSTHCGHYICHVRQDMQWIMYNDDRVVKVPKPQMDQGYFFIFSRID